MVWTRRAVSFGGIASALRGGAMLIALLGCAQAHDVDAENGRVGGGAGMAAPASRPIELDAECEADIARSLDGLPEDFACTGLYTDVADKDFAPGVHGFEPAVPLWSDGSGKGRWIYLPEGTQIDASDPKAWVFPLGTKLWKEFKADGRRVETRIFEKTREDRWSRATYEWNDDETAAMRSDGRDRPDVEINGAVYHVPTGSECDQCHKGRKERILGFEMISLAQSGATGMTMERLIDEDLISPVPEREELEIGDDGTGLAKKALGWMHINCGVSCHNDNQVSEAYSSGLRLKLDPAQLDGRSSANFEILRTTVGVPAKTLRWNNAQRIVAGSPEDSLLYQLASVRRPGKNNQMPPIASRVVPREEVEVLADWIRAMGQNGGQPSAGGPD
jgi:hypothetical protein